jgi:hypothetical protein
MPLIALHVLITSPWELHPLLGFLVHWYNASCVASCHNMAQFSGHQTVSVLVLGVMY